MEGQGTIAYEFMKQVPDLDRILVNVGGGGMISGIALYAKRVNPKIKIIGIQAKRVFPLENYNKTGKLVTVDAHASTIADGCNVKHPGGRHDDILRTMVDEYYCVEEDTIASMIIRTLLETRTLSEGAGCMGLAALLNHQIPVSKGEKTGVVICGGNIDIVRLYNNFKLGTTAMGLRLRAKVLVEDKPGKLLELYTLI